MSHHNIKKSVLMVAYHFPPCTGSSGIQRTLKFSRYLPDYGWQPIVLSPHPRVYPSVRQDLMREIHPDAIVKRVWAIDISRHLSINGIYISSMALPDRWSSWILSAVPAGISLIKKYKPQYIWSTYPIATAHVIALLLNRITKVPLIADFRDPMLYENWPVKPILRSIHGSIERKVVHASKKIIVTTPSTRKLYRQRYPELPDDRWDVVSNGYDEENFSGENYSDPIENNHGKLLLVHSGLMEPEDRDPSTFFRVLSSLKEAGKINADNIAVVLRATGHDSVFEKQIAQLNIQDIVTLQGHISYSEALQEMQVADGLLLFQGRTCNRQIPAKIYEYLRAYKPILAMADHAGDTAALLRDSDIDTIAAIDSFEEIYKQFVEFLDMLKNGAAPVAQKATVEKYSRRALTRDLAKIFDNLDSTA
ncbi:MAG: glycosyltransferase family 4 protein [Gammaproteobacteria bacterium]|nr:glycosyltransferase family 4 protein [Gammaproteobacteria bacterium]